MHVEKTSGPNQKTHFFRFPKP
uniref:Uncharacterized protein n=1 Tax=Anguilla anguilla TaxID=7936 RepID=A0A0E9TCJ2_ANGAN